MASCARSLITKRLLFGVFVLTVSYSFKQMNKWLKSFAQFNQQLIMKLSRTTNALISLLFIYLFIFRHEFCGGMWRTQNGVNGRSRSDKSEREERRGGKNGTFDKAFVYMPL